MRPAPLWILLLVVPASVSPCGAQEKSPPTPQDHQRISAPGHWPQWRGPNRDNISTETGLLKEWPPGGPKLLWKAEGLGTGVGCISVAGGLVFLMGYRGDLEFLTALDGAGAVVWSVPIGPTVQEMSQMRWLSQRTPTIDDDRVYAFTARGVLRCLRSVDGQLLWKRDYESDFKGNPGHWGYCDFPLVDEGKLICTPGGSKPTIIALNKKTGETLWTCGISQSRGGTYSAPLVCELGGVRQYVQQLDCGAVGISAKDGKQLWFYEGTEARGMGNVHPAIPWKKDSLVTLCGWGVGLAILEFAPNKGGTQFVVRHRVMPGNVRSTPDAELQPIQIASWYGSTLRVGDRLFAPGSPAIDLGTGKALPELRLGGITVTFAEGLFYTRGGNGTMALCEAGSMPGRVFSEFEAPQRREQTLTFPVVAGGRLYLRDQGDLYCYDVRGADYKEPPKVWEIPSKPGTKKAIAGTPNAVPRDLQPPPGEPDAIFVPTPQDVVEKMIELAKVTKDDVVYDLGSGDGRIVLTASRNKGCKSVGFEMNPGLVWESQFKAKQQKLEGLVTIEEKDLFAADLSQATVVTLYLGAKNNARLLPQLQKLKPGSRIVSHAHLLGDEGPKPDQEVKINSNEDSVEHTIYVWTLPFKPGSDRK